MQRILVTVIFSLILLFPFTSQAKNNHEHKAKPARVYRPSMPITGTDTPTAFDQRFVSFLRRWGIPGASVTIMRNGQILMSRGYGYADLQTREPVQPNSLFRIGSVSKAITAVSILKLVQDGQLRLDNSAFGILNDLSPLDRQAIPQINQITVRNLLQMASGWQTDWIDPMFGPWSHTMMTQLENSNSSLPPPCLTAARLMMGIPLHSRPGTQYSYSNINYCVLGLLVNKASGQPYNYLNYQNYVQQNVLAPAGITDMRIGDTLPQNRVPNEVKYYQIGAGISDDPADIVSSMTRIDGLPYSNSQILKRNFADGGWIASSIDLAKFLQGIVSHKILSSNMVNVMLQRPSYSKNPKGDYFAMGFNVRHIANYTYFMKTGSFTGTYAVAIQRSDGTSYGTVFNTKPSQRPLFVGQLVRVLNTAG